MPNQPKRIFFLLLVVAVNAKSVRKNSCPPLASTDSTTVNCTSVDCANKAVFKCDPFYEIPKKHFSRTCLNGSWTKKCVPKCGSRPGNYYPWNVALFINQDQKKIFRCAATLISEKVLLTAATCVSDQYNKPLPPRNVTAAAGKSSTNYSDPLDTEAQYAEIENIFLPKNYTGSLGKYANNIAVVITKAPFNFTERIQPVCLKKNVPKQGYIAGPLKSSFFPDLKEVYEIEVPMANKTRCYEMLAAQPDRGNFTDFYTYDKLCGGYINSDQVPKCRTDNGVGLVTKIADRYYLTGVTGPFNAVFYHSSSCDNQRWILFTDVEKFYGFIKKFVN